jgi:hypothetical protein
MHVTLRKYDHATHVLLGNTQVTILGVGQKKHPVLKIATNFFPGEGGWRSVRSKIRQSRDSLVFLRVARGTGIDLGSFTPGALSLKKVTAKKRKNVKMTWNPKSEAFFFTKMNSGTYELSYPPAGNYALRFDLNIMDGTSQFATFDPKNLPFDPEYQMQPGDESIAPGDIPSAITDYRSLRRFVLAAFPFESRVYKTRNQHITLTRQIYSSLLATYPNLKKDGDIDKFAMSETLSIDWIKDFKSDGVLANKLVWQEIIKEEPKDPGDGGGGGGGIPDGITIPKSEPSEVYNLTTLREFALYHFGAQLFVYQTPNVQGLAKQVRDKIVARYSRYFLPWSDSNVRHFDAFADRIAVTTIDFVTASSAPGQLYYKLTWSVHEDPWWAK